MSVFVLQGIHAELYRRVESSVPLVEHDLHVLYPVVYYVSHVLCVAWWAVGTWWAGLFYVHAQVMLLYMYLYMYKVQLKKENPFGVRGKADLTQFECLRTRQGICTICYELLDETCVCGQTCVHLFHRSCLGRWWTIQPTCPVCRTCV